MSNKPVATIRDGSIKASIWRNEAEKGPFYSVDIVRGYKDKDGNWKDTTSFSGSELLRVSNLAGQAYNKILELKASDHSEAEAA